MTFILCLLGALLFLLTIWYCLENSIYHMSLVSRIIKAHIKGNEAKFEFLCKELFFYSDYCGASVDLEHHIKMFYSYPKSKELLKSIKGKMIFVWRNND